MADGARKTVHEIAATLIKEAPVSEEVTDDTSPNEGEEAELEDQTGEDIADDEEEIVDDSDDDEDVVDEGDEQDDSEDEDDEGDDQETDDDADDQPYLAVKDDDLIEVKIDGETVLRSIGDAKKALSGEGAIEKRLQEATETRKQAQADHNALLRRYEESQQTLAAAVSELEQVALTPLVSKPSRELEQRDPKRYLQHLRAYEADQKRINDAREKVQAFIDGRKEDKNKATETYRQEQTKLLLERLPELGDKTKGQKLFNDMAHVAMSQYGFSEEELAQLADHRLYLALADLAKFHGARSPKTGEKSKVKDVSGQANKRPRVLRSGGTKARAQVKAKDAARKKVTETARTSGKVKDVARTLIK